jgi:hypothetical protein
MKNPFPPESRYHALELTEFEVSEFVSVAYVRRRFVPGPERFALQFEHEVKQHERLDRITALHVGNPELFWRLCDANAAMRPNELERFGRRLRITGPEGLPAPGVPDV